MPKVSSYTVAKKLEVVDWHRKNGGNVSLSSRHFGIDRKRIREWITKENELLQNNFGKGKQKRRLNGGSAPLSEELDDDLFEFFQVEREKGRAVSNKLLAEEALRIGERLGLPSFKASDQFINNWKRRFHVSMRKSTNDSQKIPEEYKEAVHAFSVAVKECRLRHDYTPFNIGNMDQTMVRFDNPASRTNNLAGESSIRIADTGCSRRGFTVSLCARASGHKMPAFVILKEPTGRIPPRVQAALQIPTNVKVSSTRNGWMSAEKLEEWVNRVWLTDHDDVRRLLILDKAPIHASVQCKNLLSSESVNTDLVLIPGGCTSFLQPADVSWNKPFKDSLRAQWASFKRDDSRTAQGNPKKPSRQDVISWVGKAWAEVSEEIVAKSFKCCGISNALDGSEDGLFHSRLAEISEVDNIDEQECVDLLFDEAGSDEEFLGFSDVDEDCLP